jgi:D-glycero-beta-D-manno-heptose 1-phosphate adenylyltransferase
MGIKSKIMDARELAQRLQDLRKAGESVVFTNGCFDLLHVGHVRYLAAARSEGDLLVVGLNTDRSVRLIKGNNRPIVGQKQRAEILASLECVNFVTLFDESDPLKLIQLLNPTVLVKGADWKDDEIVGAEFVKTSGGRVVRVPLVGEASTSAIINTILNRYRSVSIEGKR